MILKHKTTTEMVKKFLEVIERRVSRDQRQNLMPKRNMETSL